MGTTNFGNQTLRFDYNQEATSSSFNERFYNVIESGIYSGGLLTKNPSFNNKVSVSPMHVYIYDDATGLACHIETSASVSDIVVSQSTPWIVLSFDWADATDNYMDVLAVSYAQLQANDDYVVVGRAFYISGVLQTDFDYTYRKTPGINYSTTKFSAFRVKSLEDAGTPKRVSVEEGLALVNNTLIDFSGGTSSDITDTGAQGRYDVIYVSLAGNVEIIEGTPAVTPTAPSYPKEGIAVAEIRRGANRNTVNGADIFQVDPDRNITTNLDWGVGVGQVNADDIPLGTAITKTVTGGTNISIANTTYVRAGIQAVVDALYDLSSVANDSVLERHINWGHAATQVGAEDVPFTSVDFTATDVDAALQELYDIKFGKSGGTITGNLTIQGILDLTNKYLSFATTTKSSNYSIADESIILADTSSNDIELTLPLATDNGRVLYIKKTVDDNVLTIVRNGTNTIEGTETEVSLNYQSTLLMVSDGSGTWYIL